MNKLVEYKTLVNIQAKRDVLVKEEHEEEANLHILTLRKGDLTLSSSGKEYSRKLMTRINNFYKSVDDEEKDTMFLLVNNRETGLNFKRYLLDAVQKKEVTTYRNLFEDNGFVRDIERLLQEKSFHHKSEMEKQGKRGFWSANARREWSRLEVIKLSEQSLYSIAGRSRKNYIHMLDGTSVRLNAEQEEQQSDILTNAIRDVVYNAVDEALGLNYEWEEKTLLENDEKEKLN